MSWYPYEPGERLFGGSPVTPAMPQPFQPGAYTNAFEGTPPTHVFATVYYPDLFNAHSSVGNPLNIARGPFPILLYAHAYRGSFEASLGAHSAGFDYTSVAAMLRRVASCGCVCVVPDLSWLTDDGGSAPDAVNLRAIVLANYLTYLMSVNDSVFAGQLDPSRIIVAGHSTGARGATHAARTIAGFDNHAVCACGLIAPENGGDSGPDIHNLLVIGGTSDDQQGASPVVAYEAGGTPKTLVTIGGANHFGYTDICPADNTCGGINLFDEDGAITRQGQQQTAAAYLVALVRYYALHDDGGRLYLEGERIPEGLDQYGVTDVQVRSSGFGRLPITLSPVIEA